jgi:hypothetical protein
MLIHVLCMDGKEICHSSDIDDLKRCVSEAVAAFTCDMLWRVWEEQDYRFDIATSHVGLISSACKVWK